MELSHTLQSQWASLPLRGRNFRVILAVCVKLNTSRRLSPVRGKWGEALRSD